MTAKTVILTIRNTWTDESKYNCTFGRNRTKGNNAPRGKHPKDASKYRPQNISRLLQPPLLQATKDSSAKASWRGQNLSLGHCFSPAG